jgi:iron(III) transport system ATP-binding protein
VSFLRVESASKRFGAVAALRDVSLSVARGGRTAVVGPSGSGKTTLLRLIAGFEAPDQGRIVLDGAVLAEDGRHVPAHRRGVGVVAQDGALFPHLSIAANIGFGRARGAARAARVEELMRLVDLDPALRDRYPDQLSGGQQQRVALARALALRPRLMLLDEPFSALDTGLRAATRRAVAEVLARAGVTTLLVTHDQGEALSFADQLAIMRDGRLLQSGTPRDLYAAPADPDTALFLGEALILPAEVVAGQARCALGVVPVQPGAPSGPATIMLRPEQITLTPASGGGIGVVRIAEFAGATCSYALTLHRPVPDGPACLPIRQPGLSAVPDGTAVDVAVSGCAHAFASPAFSAPTSPPPTSPARAAAGAPHGPGRPSGA